jgi:aspartate carbamoyltransferase catalytic subunit
MSPAASLQLAADGRLRHLLTLEGLPAATLERLLAAAEAIRPQAMGGAGLRAQLAGRTVCTLFFEPSTRTRGSFQLAATRLGADVLGFDVHTSSARKGESALDTMRTLEAMGVDCFIVRHAHNGMVASLAGPMP